VTVKRLTLDRVVAWTTLIAGSAVVGRAVAREAPGVRMLAWCTFGLLVLKVIVIFEERARGMASLSIGAWFGFLFGWPGMQPRIFAAPNVGPLPEAFALIRGGLGYATLGAALVLAARLAWTAIHSRLLATVLLLPGLSLIVHFGLFDVLAGAWRLRGVACDELFRAPWRSKNLGDFWSRRWNLAFSQMTSIAVYRPLAGRWGRGAALMAGFVVSGLLHEMAISFPVKAGYGLPLLYFVIHGALALVERELERTGRRIPVAATRTWAFVWLVGPLPLLFHRHFLAGVVWPLIGIDAGD
jgi:alginate O-acetyltransferase complex protein AlgI